MNTRYRSKIDGRMWFVGLAMPCVALIAVGTSAGRNDGPVLLLALLTTLVAAVVVWIVLSTYYEFTADQLVAHSGPFSWRIPLEDVTAVRESNSVRSGPALSLDRLEIAWGGRHVLLISHEDKSGFLAALRRRVPHLAALETRGRPETH